jgi:hypothetical protein
MWIEIVFTGSFDTMENDFVSVRLSVCRRKNGTFEICTGTIDIGNGSAEIFKDFGYAKSYRSRLS